MNEEDFETLKELIEKDHISRNGVNISECGYDNCWHRRIIKELKGEEKK